MNEAAPPAERSDDRGAVTVPDAADADRGPGGAEDALTIGETAALLGVSVSTLRNWDRQGKLPAARHPLNRYRLYARETVLRLRERIAPAGARGDAGADLGAERRFDVPFIAPLALSEKQIQQSYRPYIQVHKWFARRPGTLFRGLLLAEFGGKRAVRRSFFESNDLSGGTVLDPFMGGGTPVLEANRLGLDVIGCDINPMAAWVVRQELAALDTRVFGEIARALVDEVEETIGRYYRTTCGTCGGDAEVKYFIWAKQLPCAKCSEPVDLLPGYLVASNARHPNFVFFCPECRGLFELSTLPERGADVTCARCRHVWKNDPVAHRNKYVCRSCGHAGRYPEEMVPHGPPKHTLIAIEYHCGACKPTHKGRFFKSPTEEDYRAFREARGAEMSVGGRRLVPDEEIPEGDETTRLHRWGYRRYAELFNERQRFSLAVLAEAISKVPDTQHRHALATVFSDFLRYQNMLGRYDTYALKCQDIFSVHGFPVGLIQCENNVLGIPRVGTGGFRHFVAKYTAAKEYNRRPFEVERTGSKKRRVYLPSERIGADFVARSPEGRGSRRAWISRNSVESLELPPESVDAVLTDPPYFDNVQYAELMDFCYVWLRRLINGDVPGFDAISTRTDAELTGNKTAGRDLGHFCSGLSRVYGAAARALKPGGLFAFTYHHNDPAAYLPVAVALLDAGLEATASLPCPAEMSASLHIAKTGSSVVDTILCARKAPTEEMRSALALSGIPEALAHQADLLRAGGLEPSVGDLRCMALGLLTIVSVNELRRDWQASRDVEERLASVRVFFETALRELGGLDTLVVLPPTGVRSQLDAEQMGLPL